MFIIVYELQQRGTVIFDFIHLFILHIKFRIIFQFLLNLIRHAILGFYMHDMDAILFGKHLSRDF